MKDVFMKLIDKVFSEGTYFATGCIIAILLLFLVFIPRGCEQINKDEIRKHEIEMKKLEIEKIKEERINNLLKSDIMEKSPMIKRAYKMNDVFVEAR
jgi:hypothetical protein